MKKPNDLMAALAFWMARRIFSRSSFFIMVGAATSSDSDSMPSDSISSPTPQLRDEAGIGKLSARRSRTTAR